MPAKPSAFVCAAWLGILTSLNSVMAQGWIATTAPITNWFALAASADGSTLVAAVNHDPYQSGNGGPIYVSTDSGGTWTIANAPITNWIALASSADGTRLV